MVTSWTLTLRRTKEATIDEKRMTILATLQLHEAGDTRCLAGHAVDEETVFVLRKQAATVYELHQIPISNAEQSLRSLLAADQSQAGELVNAILQARSKPPRKPRTKRKESAKQ